MNRILDSIKITEMAKKLFAEKRAGNRLDGWFIAKEAELRLSKDFEGENEEVKKGSYTQRNRENYSHISERLSAFCRYSG